MCFVYGCYGEVCASVLGSRKVLRSGMAFTYIKRVKRNGKVYEYPELRESRRVPGKKHPVSFYLGKSRREEEAERAMEVGMHSAEICWEKSKADIIARGIYNPHVEAERAQEKSPAISEAATTPSSEPDGQPSETAPEGEATSEDA